MNKLKRNVAISESGFVFNASRGESFSTNPIGVEILELFREGKTEEEIADDLVERYDIDRATVEKDIYDFVKVLQQSNLMEEGTV